MEPPIKVKLGCNLGSCMWTCYTQQKTNKAARIVYCIQHCMCWCPSFLWRWQPVRLILSSDQICLSDTAFIQTSCEQVEHCAIVVTFHGAIVLCEWERTILLYTLHSTIECIWMFFVNIVDGILFIITYSHTFEIQ